LDRRGVSPVIAVLLLIVITVAAAVLVYIWLIGFMQSQTTTTGSTALGEELKFEAAALFTNGTFRAYIRNVGDTAIKIVTIYLLDADGQKFYQKYDFTTPIKIDVNQVKEVAVRFSVSITGGKVYVVKLVSSIGTEFTIKLKAVAPPS